jgi:DNA-binding transcriptional regulator GbsR (MarR family)
MVMTGEPVEAFTNGHHPDLVKVHDSMVDGLGQLSDYFGFSNSMGQLYGVLLMSSAPLSLDDMMDRLGISKANVSMNMRTLEHMGMVRQVWVRGRNDRRKYYEAETDFLQIIANILSGRELRDVDRAITVMTEDAKLLSEVMPELNDLDKKQAELYLQRIDQLQTLFQFAQVLIASILERVADIDLEEISQIEL